MVQVGKVCSLMFPTRVLSRIIIMNMWVRLYVNDVHCVVCFCNSVIFSLIFRTLLNVWKNWLIFSLSSHYGSCICSCHEVWLSKITTTNELHGAVSFLGKLLVSELVKKVLHQATQFCFPKYLNIQQRCFENLKDMSCFGIIIFEKSEASVCYSSMELRCQMQDVIFVWLGILQVKQRLQLRFL